MYLIEVYHSFHATHALIVGSPTAKQLLTPLFHLPIRQIGSAAEAKPLEQRLVGEGTLETRPSILNKTVKKRQRTELLVGEPVLELLPDCTSGLRGPRVLQVDDLDQFWNPAQVMLGLVISRQTLNNYSDGSVWFLLRYGQWLPPLKVISRDSPEKT
jgi:hypothetical protein